MKSTSTLGILGIQSQLNASGMRHGIFYRFWPENFNARKVSQAQCTPHQYIGTSRPKAMDAVPSRWSATPNAFYTVPASRVGLYSHHRGSHPGNLVHSDDFYSKLEDTWCSASLVCLVECSTLKAVSSLRSSQQGKHWTSGLSPMFSPHLTKSIHIEKHRWSHGNL